MDKIQLQKFEIVLNGNKNFYQLGEKVIGKCIIELKGELQLSKIKMKLKGQAKVNFTRGSAKYSSTHKDKIKYLEMGYNFNTFNRFITKGIHELPFFYQLPKEGIPSSFIGFHGSVKYWIETEIEKPMFSFNHKTSKKIEFKVEAPLICENLMEPLIGSQEKKFGFLNPISGNISVGINIDKKGYIPGQLISMNCKITNNSSKHVTPRATLKQIQTFIAGGQRTSVETKYIVVDGIPVNQGSTNNQTFKVPIPVGIQLSLECNILSVTYVLHVTIEVPSARNLHLHVPIIITSENILAKSIPYSMKINKWITFD